MSNTIMRPIGFYEKRGHVWYSEGITPICGSEKNPAPHVSLGLGEYNEETRLHYVIDQGTFVSVEDGMLVPCNGGKANEVLYSATDKQHGVVDIATGKTVTVGSKKTFKANKPIGVLVWDVFQNPDTMPNGFKVETTQTAPTIRTEGVVVLPMVYKLDSAITGDSAEADKALVKKFYADLEIGDLVCADSTGTVENAAKLSDLVPTARTGYFRKWIAGEDAPEQIVGRVLAIEADSQWSTQGLEFVKADGIDVQSEATHGFPRHIWNAFKETKVDSTLTNLYSRKVVLINTNTK